MGAMTTLRVSRDDALTALARIEHAALSDSQIEDRLNQALRDGGYSLDEVSISSFGGSRDLEDLERMTNSITC